MTGATRIGQSVVLGERRHLSANVNWKGRISVSVSSVHVASSFVCTSLVAVITVVGVLDTRRVSRSAEFWSFLLCMCIEAPESTTNTLPSGFVEDGAGRHQTSELADTFGRFPHNCAGASFLSRDFFFRSVFKSATLVRIRMLNYILYWTISFPEFSCGVMYHFWINCTLRFARKNFVALP